MCVCVCVCARACVRACVRVCVCVCACVCEGGDYFVFCFGITYDCVKRVQASNNTLLDKPVNGVACPSNVESEAPNMRIDIQKRNMQHPSFSESELELNSPRRIVLCCSVIRS